MKIKSRNNGVTSPFLAKFLQRGGVAVYSAQDHDSFLAELNRKMAAGELNVVPEQEQVGADESQQS